MYRLTRKATEQRTRQLEAMRRGKIAARMRREPEPRPVDLPHLRIRITVERFDFGHQRNVVELHRTRRVDSYAVMIDGQQWKVCGITGALEGVRKSLPRVMSPRRL